ncbi:MAG TPA: MamI family restriction endonuclease [Anaerolineae bacterium]|nr:MamI family restriction endonuclease [Anaerolineae bacterium]
MGNAGNGIGELGTQEASERLIRDLYTDLRTKLAAWSQVTHQTAQARMGYVGQHLVSVVTGCPGGKSGARGKDLLLPDGGFAEIKTCYRVDQLGYCEDCRTRTSPLEAVCPECGSKALRRPDDSKWLISIRNDEEFEQILGPRFYFLVLLDFTDTDKPDTIRASIWRVDPHSAGFSMCMVDYYFNIRAKSKSKAPFNLWPYSPKFYMMKPRLCYRSLILPDNSIDTQVLKAWDDPEKLELCPLSDFARATTITREALSHAADRLAIPCGDTKSKSGILAAIDLWLESEAGDCEQLSDCLAAGVYAPLVAPHLARLGTGLRQAVSPFCSE